MRRVLSFASRFLLVGLLVVVGIFAFLLVAWAPLRVEGGIASVTIRRPDQSYVRISGHTFTCTNAPTVDQCTVEISGRLLAMNVTYDSEKRESFQTGTQCQATYDRRSVPCGVYYDYATGKLPNLELNSEDLGLTTSQFQGLQRQSFLTWLDSFDLLWVITWTAIVCGALVAMVIWLHPHPLHPIFTSLSLGTGSSIGTLVLVWLLGRFATGFTDFNVYGFLGLSLGAGAGMAVLTRRQTGWMIKLLTGICSGGATFIVLWYGTLISLLLLGYVD